MADNVDVMQTMPYDAEAEKSVLGSILFDEDKLADVEALLTPRDFYLKAHQLIFKAMIDLNDTNTNIDVVTLNDYLKKHDQLEDIGGITYLTQLASAVPTAGNAEYYAQIVADKSRLRRLINVATSISQQSYDQSENPDDILEKAERDLANIADDRDRNGFRAVGNLLSDAFKQLDMLSQRSGEVTGLPTGYRELDRLIDGLHPDDFDVIAARPGMGKTAFALNLAINAGHYLEKQRTTTSEIPPIAIFSLEMSAEQLVNRMICAEGNIDANHLRIGKLDDDENNAFVAATGSLSQIPIYIDDTPGQKVTEIRAKSRRLAREHGGLGLILVDYLQLIEGTGQENRQQEVSAISRQLKKLAKELKVPVIALSQLSRGVEQRQDKRPMLSDIRESGSIEQDADVVSFLYRADYYRDEDADEHERHDNDNSEVEVIVEKNRAGARGTAHLLFFKSHNKFATPANRSEEM